MCLATFSMVSAVGKGDVLGLQDNVASLATLIAVERTREAKYMAEKSEQPAPKKEAPSLASILGGAADTPKNPATTVPDDEVSTIPAMLMTMPLMMLGDELTTPMLGRMFERIHHYGTTTSQRALPLALAMHSMSRPDQALAAALHRMAHHTDTACAFNAIVALGFLGAGTADAHVAQTIKSLRMYYRSSATHLAAVRLAHGMLHMGKGLVGLHPVHRDGKVPRPRAIGGLLVALTSLLSHETFIDGDYLMLFPMALAMTPRSVITVDRQLNPVGAEVRVGQKIDVVGLSGTPRKIAGFQVHKSPVLMGLGSLAEVVSEEYTPVTTKHEGVVLVSGAGQIQEEDVE